MHHFPHLEALIKKNENYWKLFPKSQNWLHHNGEGISSAETNRVVLRKTTLTQDPQNCKYKMDGGDSDNVKGASGIFVSQKSAIGDGKFVHWKKQFQEKFHFEMKLSFLQSNLLRERPSSSGSTNCTECGICEKSFGNAELLDQHKTGTHFSQQFDSSFCYLPYFIEPSKCDVSRGNKSMSDCSVCKKWLGGVKGGIITYLEGRTKKLLKENPDKETKKRGRKPKSMARRVCELCSKILSNRKGLERHMLIHTGEKPFPCNVCGKPFRRKDNCARHKKTAHLFKKPRKPRCRRAGNISSFVDAAT